MSFLRLLLAVAVAAWIATGAAAARQDEIPVGMTAAFSGPLQLLGRSMQSGIEICFAETNAAGGIKGRPLRLIALDDSYDPETAAANMRRLVRDHGVIAMVGSVGTPTAVETLPIARAEKVLLFGAFTGADILRPDPPERYVINFRASYGEETAAMVGGLLAQGIKPREIAFFTQDDAYGFAGYDGAIRALAKAGFDGSRLAHGRYRRNTLAVEDALITLLDSDIPPRAIIMVAAYGPAAKFIRLARRIFPDTLFLNLSFVGSEPLREALGPDGDGVIVTEVVPLLDSDLPAVHAFHKARARFRPDDTPNLVMLEGYLAARVFVEGLRAAPRIDREGVIDGLESLGNFDIGLGEPLTLTPDDHQASRMIWPTRFENGRSVSLPGRDWTAASAPIP